MSEHLNDSVESVDPGDDLSLVDAFLDSYGTRSNNETASLITFDPAPYQCTPDNLTGSDGTQRATMSAPSGINFTEPTTMLDSERAHQLVLAAPFALAGTFVIAEVVGASPVGKFTVEQIGKMLTYLQLGREMLNSASETKPRQ